jgi:hypothetical protein
MASDSDSVVHPLMAMEVLVGDAEVEEIVNAMLPAKKKITLDPVPHPQAAVKERAEITRRVELKAVEPQEVHEVAVDEVVHMEEVDGEDIMDEEGHLHLVVWVEGSEVDLICEASSTHSTINHGLITHGLRL